MLHGVKFSEWTFKTLKDLFVYAKEQDDKDLKDRGWLNNLYRCSNCSLLNENGSIMVFGLSVATCMPWPFLSWNPPVFFKILWLPMQLQTGVSSVSFVTMITPYFRFITPCFLWDPLTTNIRGNTGSNINNFSYNKCWVLMNRWRRVSHHDQSMTFFLLNLRKHLLNRG